MFFYTGFNTVDNLQIGCFSHFLPREISHNKISVLVLSSVLDYPYVLCHSFKYLNNFLSIKGSVNILFFILRKFMSTHFTAICTVK